jgi:hypothetical protein
MHMHLTLMMMMKLVKEAYVGDSKGKKKQASLGNKVCVAKQTSVARSLEFFNYKAYIDTMENDSDDKFWASFPRDHNSRNFILGGPQRSDMTAAEEKITIKQYKKGKEVMQGSHSPTKNA